MDSECVGTVESSMPDEIAAFRARRLAILQDELPPDRRREVATWQGLDRRQTPGERRSEPPRRKRDRHLQILLRAYEQDLAAHEREIAALRTQLIATQRGQKDEVWGP